MTLILIKDRPKVSMTKLMFLTLKWIYEEKTMPSQDVQQMQEGFVFWNEYFNWLKEANVCQACKGTRFRFGGPCIECSSQGFIMSMSEKNLNERLMEAAKLYQLNTDGEFDKRKEMFKAHNIDWRKFHKLPGSVTAEDKHKAAEMKAEYDKKYPEQEGLI